MTRLITLLFAVSILWLGCADSEFRTDPPPTLSLADTLVDVFSELQDAISVREYDRFLELLDPVEATRLKQLARRHGFASLHNYIRLQFAEFPDPDTLAFVGITEGAGYARVEFAGRADQFGHREERVLYTFILYKRQSSGWKVAAISSLEKERFDSYGTEVSYFETDLPPRLRFPRLF